MIKPPAHMQKKISIIVLFVIALMASLFGSVSHSASEKMTPEELVAKHLASIGTAKARESVNSRIVVGTSQVIFRTPPPGQASGRAVLASEGVKNLIGMSFPSPVYPREQLGFDGSSFNAAFVTPGVRSALGNFLMTHTGLFKQGLIGGTLSSAWPLLDLTVRGPQLEYAGTKKVDDRTLHQLRYAPRGGSDLKSTLFFDQEMFQHVRSEHERVIPAPTGTVDYANIQEREIRYKMIEQFSDFRPEGELSLPHTYKIKLSVDSQGGTFLAEWVIKLTQFTFNERLDPKSFSISAD